MVSVLFASTRCNSQSRSRIFLLFIFEVIRPLRKIMRNAELALCAWIVFAVGCVSIFGVSISCSQTSCGKTIGVPSVAAQAGIVTVIVVPFEVLTIVAPSVAAPTGIVTVIFVPLEVLIIVAPSVAAPTGIVTVIFVPLEVLTIVVPYVAAPTRKRERKRGRERGTPQNISF